MSVLALFHYSPIFLKAQENAAMILIKNTRIFLKN